MTKNNNRILLLLANAVIQGGLSFSTAHNISTHCGLGTGQYDAWRPVSGLMV